MNFRAYWRFLVVVWQFLPLLVGYARDRRRFILFGRSRTVTAEIRRRRAQKLLNSLLSLGPTFIKLGQILSTRPDILPPEYILEFQKLQDSVPPAAWEDAKTVIEAEVGPVSERFDDFETDPISGASLGQVYKAKVDGEPVAVKIRRPGVEELVEADLRVVRWSVPLLIRFVDETRSFSLETLADEFAKTIRQEMDYEREAGMLKEIRGNFRENDSMRIPQVIDSHSTTRVLTMEYVEGVKITDLDKLDQLGIDRSRLAERLQTIYLQMIIEDGVFHADPHPGNLAVAEDGTIIFYDFGMSGYVDPFIQDRIIEFYTAVARQDIDAILDSLVEMGTLSPNADRKLMGEIMELAITDLRGDDIEQYRIQQIVQQVEDTIYEFPLRLPSNLALVLRVATVVEGVCVTLDSNFDFISVATEYLGKEGYLEEGARKYVAERGKDVQQAAGSMVRVPAKLEETLDSVNRGRVEVSAELNDPKDYFDRLAKRFILGMILSAGLLSTTLLGIFSTTGWTLFSAGVTAGIGFLLYRSFSKRRGIRAQPQFTRQRLREGEEGALGFGDSIVPEGQQERDTQVGDDQPPNRFEIPVESTEADDSEP